MAISSFFALPLLPGTPQQFTTALGNTNYILRTLWSPAQNCWTLDINDANNNLLIGNIALVTGADLLEQYEYIGIGGGLLVENTGIDADAVPGFRDFGVNSQVLFFSYPTGT